MDRHCVEAHLPRRPEALTWSAPSPRACHRDLTDRLVTVAAVVLAERMRTSPDDPEPQIAATALRGLWSIQFKSLGKLLDGARTPTQIHKAVTADVRRAARLLDTGPTSCEGIAPTRAHIGSPVHDDRRHRAVVELV